MLKNFHTHTARCHHADGSDEEYVLAALNSGYTEIGFSDHTPMLFTDKYVSNFRMAPNDIYEYISSIRSLQEKYKSKIKIHIGCEFEYYPKLYNETFDFIKNAGIEYLILGQHYTMNEYDKKAHYSGAPTFNKNVLEQYARQVADGASKGVFSYVAHPDLINFNGRSSVYTGVMTDLCQELKRINVPLEANLLGYTNRRNYPNSHFWEIVSKVGNEVVIGLDAHSPQVYSDINAKDELCKFIGGFGIKINDDIQIKSI